MRAPTLYRRSALPVWHSSGRLRASRTLLPDWWSFVRAARLALVREAPQQPHVRPTVNTPSKVVQLRPDSPLMAWDLVGCRLAIPLPSTTQATSGHIVVHALMSTMPLLGCEPAGSSPSHYSSSKSGQAVRPGARSSNMLPSLALVLDLEVREISLGADTDRVGRCLVERAVGVSVCKSIIRHNHPGRIAGTETSEGGPVHEPASL